MTRTNKYYILSVIAAFPMGLLMFKSLYSLYLTLPLGMFTVGLLLLAGYQLGKRDLNE